VTRPAPAHWAIRDRLSPDARRLARRLADTMLEPLGSITGATGVGRRFALTFDDGPDPSSTPAVLAVLGAHRVRATFFLLVERAEAQPALVRRMLDEGHEVGLHGLDHARLTTLRAEQVAEQVAGGRRRLERVAGHEVTLFRPPYGAQSLRTWLAARRAGLEVVVWDGHAEDWVDHPAGTVVANAAAALVPGGVLLLHDALASDPRTKGSPRPGSPRPAFDRAEVLDRFLGGLPAGGWRPETVSGLLAAGAARHTAWFRP
jgi:peptidoglycan/xylan/chitin deacetylase (PgdA/CDA1 family)